MFSWLRALVLGSLLALGTVTSACHTTYNVTMAGPVDEKQEAAELYAKVAMPTVQIQAEHGWGSGVVFGDGKYVLTAAHVVSFEAVDENGFPVMMAEENPVIFKNEGISPFLSVSKVVKMDTNLDLAILELKNKYIYKSASFSPSDPYLYQKCWASGHPHAVTDTTITEGRVQDLWDEGFIRYSAQTTFGNSGGPVFIRVDGKYVVSSIVQRVHTEGGVATTHLGLGCLPFKVREFVNGY